MTLHDHETPPAHGAEARELEATKGHQAMEPIARDRLIRHLERAQRLSRTGSWEWNVTTGRIQWSSEIFRVFGLEPSTFNPTYAAFLEQVHPDDRQRVETQVELALAGQAPYDISHRIVRPDGSVRFVHEQGEVEVDAVGRPARMLGAVRDVTEIAQAEAASRRSQEMLASMLRISPEAILLTDPQARILAFSAGAEAMFGYKSEDIIGQGVERLMPERFQSHHRGYVAEFRTGKAPSMRMHQRSEIIGLRRNGEEFPAEASLAKLQTWDGYAFTVIVRDLTERRIAEAGLIEARELAERANQAKSIFLANMSHEIRTPLNGVLGVAGALGLSDLSPKQRDMVRLIETSGRALQGLLGDILDLAKIDSGRMQVRSEAFVLGRLLEETTALFRASAAEKGVALELSMGAEAAASFVSDELKIRQVLSNLLSNAIKFTDCGEIRLSVAITDGPDPDTRQATFTVRDTGIGFDPGRAAALFERFEQDDGSTTRRFGGTGLGLAISKALVELLGGRIAATARPGQGATFSFEIPLRQDCIGSSEAAARDLPVTSAARILKVLLAEDHPINRLAVEFILDTLPVALTSVENGLRAVEAASAHNFDLILMDMQMPLMDGLTAIKQIRAEEGARGRPRAHICVLSANAFPEHQDSAISSGADGFLTKPILVEQIIELVTIVRKRSEPKWPARGSERAPNVHDAG